MSLGVRNFKLEAMAQLRAKASAAPSSLGIPPLRGGIAYEE
jgi:hypothetical protein